VRCLSHDGMWSFTLASSPRRPSPPFHPFPYRSSDATRPLPTCPLTYAFPPVSYPWLPSIPSHGPPCTPSTYLFTSRPAPHLDSVWTHLLRHTSTLVPVLLHLSPTILHLPFSTCLPMLTRPQILGFTATHACLSAPHCAPSQSAASSAPPSPYFRGPRYPPHRRHRLRRLMLPKHASTRTQCPSSTATRLGFASPVRSAATAAPRVLGADSEHNAEDGNGADTSATPLRTRQAASFLGVHSRRRSSGGWLPGLGGSFALRFWRSQRLGGSGLGCGGSKRRGCAAGTTTRRWIQAGGANPSPAAPAPSSD
jgi:hypothetical protein